MTSIEGERGNSAVLLGRRVGLGREQCDQKKIAKCLEKLPKSDFTRKMNEFDTFTKIA